MIKKEVVGYCAKAWTRHYMHPGVNNWGEKAYVWPTREGVLRERSDRGMQSVVKILRVVRKVEAPKFVIRKRYVVEYATRSEAEAVAETYQGGALCWKVVEA